ncbi:MAG: hypothetical protein WBF33_25665 [Candidatus Nitrosopolaris sp.]|jgi:hypothetical protein
MKDWDSQEKWNKYMEQETTKILADLDRIAKHIEEAHERFRNLPKYQRIIHRMLCTIIPPFYSIILRYRRWHDRKQSLYSNPRDLR